MILIYNIIRALFFRLEGFWGFGVVSDEARYLTGWLNVSS